MIDNEIDPTTGTIKLKATFANDDLRLWPGQFINARLLLTVRKAGLVVPAAVVQRGPQGSYAFVIKPDQTVEARTIKVAQTEDGVALIDDGLQDGERVVVDGQYKLQGGSKVVISNPPGGNNGGHDGQPHEGPRRGSRQTAKTNDATPAPLAAAPEIMSISEPFIRRPIATSLLMAAIILLGGLGYELLPISALPAVDFPTIQVFAQLPGASPDVMASAVTTPLERQFGQIPGLASMNSVSAFGNTTITMQFVLDREIDAAAEDVQASINAAAGVLPTNLPNPPTYNKVNPADTPILSLAITSDSLPLDKVNDLRTPCWPRSSVRSAAWVSSRSRATRNRRCACGSTRRRSVPWV